METLKDTYERRKTEIEKLIATMQLLEKKETIEHDGISEFKTFFSTSEYEVLTFQEMINILKSNVSLMIYNIIEYSVTNLVENIYSEIGKKELKYIDINDEIKKIWRRTKLKIVYDPTASRDEIMKLNEKMIDEIISEATIELHYRQTVKGGNLDGQEIIKTFKSHGLEISKENFREDILKSIKDKRNDLAHGAVSFVEAMRDKTIGDIKESSEKINKFLETLISDVEQYLAEERYMVSF